MLLASVCNPIFINTFVVFIRLYWFERRFQSIVLEARNSRRMRTRSVSKTESRAVPDRDISREEHGVAGREIKVLRAANGHVKGKKIDDEEAFREGDIAIDDTDCDSRNGSKDGTKDDKEDVSPTTEKVDVPLHRNITFADEIASPEERLPEKNKDQSIAFVENQRNPRDQATFRIPGPRDYDRGDVVERIEEGAVLDRAVTNNSNDGEVQTKRSQSISRDRPQNGLNGDDHPFKAHITIDEPDARRRTTTGPSAYNFRTRRRSDASDNEGPSTGFSASNRSRSRTFGSFLSKEREEQDPMPYLSYTATVGRNSAFVDLSEEQREELGGIEYRALKLLAVVLVTYFVGFHLLGMIILLPWMVNDPRYADQMRAVGVSPVWWYV